MDQKRITDYINSLDQGHGVLCDKSAKGSQSRRCSIIRETGALLQPGALRPDCSGKAHADSAGDGNDDVSYSALLIAQSMPSVRPITLYH